MEPKKSKADIVLVGLKFITVFIIHVIRFIYCFDEVIDRMVWDAKKTKKEGKKIKRSKVSYFNNCSCDSLKKMYEEDFCSCLNPLEL